MNFMVAAICKSKRKGSVRCRETSTRREEDLIRERHGERPSAANTPWSYNSDCLQPINPFLRALFGRDGEIDIVVLSWWMKGVTRSGGMIL
jgi:hypothetical protein